MDIITLKCLSGSFYLCFFVFFFFFLGGGYFIRIFLFFIYSLHIELVLYSVWCYTENVQTFIHPKQTKETFFAAAFCFKDVKHPKHRDRNTTQEQKYALGRIFKEISKCYLCLIYSVGEFSVSELLNINF